MLKIGLTGGIGCGKTTVSNLFSQLNIPIIDADCIAHQIVQPGQPALNEISTRFGREFIDSQGQLDRSKMRELIFSNPSQKKKLENILHPVIHQQMLAQVNQLPSHTPYCILSIPLLLETGSKSFIDRILVIDCSEHQQRQRVKARDQLTDERIDSIMASQVTRQHRLAAADDIIDNSNSSNKLAEQVKKLHNRYLNQA